jgi:hypothetical protein
LWGLPKRFAPLGALRFAKLEALAPQPHSFFNPELFNFGSSLIKAAAN